MFLVVKIVLPAIIGTLLVCIILSGILFSIRKNRHKKILLEVNKDNYYDSLCKLEKLIKNPFPAMLNLEKETIYLEIAILYLLMDKYNEFETYMNKITKSELNFVTKVWKCLYYYMIGNQEEFNKYKLYAENIYAKLTKRFASSYVFYIELLDALNQDTENKAVVLRKLTAKITTPFGNLIKEYIFKISN